MANSLYGQPFNGLIADPSPPAVWESKDKLVISLDFGTTFSGISYCFTKQKDAKIVAITNWPGAAGQAVPKIPTMISYDLKDKNAFTWGASVKRTADCVVGVKLLLDPSQDLPQYLPAEYTQQDLTKLPKKPVEIAADYIRSIYQHALAEIKKEIPESYMQMCQKHFVMSVPAVWSDAAKNATEQAARIAGIYPVTLIKEPEAAALYTIDSLKFSLSDNDTFVVCDAGGGTVDLISYEVAGHDPVLQLRELVPGTGGMAGSLGLNRRFAEAVKNLVGQKIWESFRKTKAFIHAEKTFETEVKRDFQGDIDEEYYISFPMGALPDNPKARLQSNLWEMTGKDVKEIFEPIVLHILKLIDEQVAAVKIKKPGQKLTGIFLVGGFGSSNYLLKRVEARFPGIKVLQPTDAWAAIVKGATLSNLPREASIISTCATRHYGVEAWSTYDPEADGDVPTRKWYDGTTKAETMTWYIKIGDDLFREDKIRFPFYRVLPENYTPENLIFTDILYDCQTPEAPRNRCKGKVNSNCTLVTDLRNLPKTHFKQEKNYMNETQYLLHYHIVVSVKTALMTFSLEIDGKPMNLVGVNFK